MELKKHVDTIIVIGGILSSVLWMNGKFNNIDVKIASLENRLTRIETVLIVKDIATKDMLTHKDLIKSIPD